MTAKATSLISLLSLFKRTWCSSRWVRAVTKKEVTFVSNPVTVPDKGFGLPEFKLLKDVGEES